MRRSPVRCWLYWPRCSHRRLGYRRLSRRRLLGHVTSCKGWPDSESVRGAASGAVEGPALVVAAAYVVVWEEGSWASGIPRFRVPVSY